MESRAKLFGHAIHPMLIVFPLGLFVTAVVFDVLTLSLHNVKFSQAAEYMIGAGALGGLLAAIFGIIDWVEIPTGTRAKNIGLWHGLINVAVTTLFIASYILRFPDPAHPGIAALVLSFTGTAIACVGGWLGGELVERLGISIDDDANVNARSSLRRHSHT